LRKPREISGRQHGHGKPEEYAARDLKIMTIATSAFRQMDRIARRFGHRVFPEWTLHPSQIQEIDSSDNAQPSTAIPAEAVNYLRADNPRLLELRQLYAGLDAKVKTPLVWTEEFAAKPDLTRFRGDNMWINQVDDQHLHERAYLLATYYVLANDHLGLMQKLTEDGAFGAITFEMAGRRVSRDLLDSVLEINFLDRHLQIASRSDISILDIGAGYGRLAYRMLSAFPSMSNYRCADVIAESSFVCEYYLGFRGLKDRFELVPATSIDQTLRSAKIDLAVNIHSFSECTLDAVEWWVDRLARNGVKHLLIVPNAGNHGGQLLRNNIGQDMLPVVEKNGYRLLIRESKYADPKVQKFALNRTYYWLFERAS
jgi:hypothetical protein